MENWLVFNTWEWSLSGVTLLLWLIQLVYTLVTYARPVRSLRQKPVSPPPTAWPPVSVVIYTKNESENLQQNLPAVLTQNYPTFEVIVVNDGSTDESDEVLKHFSLTYPHLYHTYIPEDAKYLSRKKLAVTVGIKAAHYETLLFTEADSRPASTDWIRSMVCGYRSAQSRIVLGFCAYKSHHGFFHKQVAFDNLKHGLEYLSSALKRHPFAGCGRNLSYQKSLFFEHKGFARSLNLQAGEDDLFVNETADSRNTEVQLSPESLTEMVSFRHFSTWKESQVSRAATQKAYRGSQRFYYAGQELGLLLYLATSLFCLIISIYHHHWGGLFLLVPYLIHLITKTIVFRKAARMFGQEPPLFTLPLLEVTTALIHLYVRIYRLFRGEKDYTFRLDNHH
ncbi:MAG: glycosyltransferase [Parabacteroides sp.]